MSTIINTPSNPSNGEDSGSNLVVGVILAVVVLGGIALFFVYGLPMMQNNANPNPSDTNINVTVPSTTPPTTQTPAK